MTEVQSIADHVIPVVRAVVESHESALVTPLTSSDIPHKLLLQIRTLAALIRSAASVAKALEENNEQIPEPMLIIIVNLQQELVDSIDMCGMMCAASSETSVTLPTGRRLPTNLDRHDQ